MRRFQGSKYADRKVVIARGIHKSRRSLGMGFEYMKSVTDLLMLSDFTLAMVVLAIKVFEKTTLED